MYLKEIKLAGFKSFANQININFNKAINCIVGPNGSGKSNIIDAVRFVLGEQSIKSLRGTEAMSDVIFSGSKDKESQKMASVELIFDNTDRYLKIDYTEVSLKRKVYITGENDYFLNGEKCRLKDIKDLFEESGLSNGSFNIISQGEIQKIISSKPEDRRIIFEEAAAVLQYKKRKEEATRKIEKTNHNLNRVTDIINELMPDLEPLQKQSSIAKNYLAEKKELDDLTISLIIYDIDTLNFDYQQAKRKMAEFNEELLAQSTKTIEHETTVAQMKKDLIELDQDLFAAQKELASLSSQVEKLKAQKEMLTERQKYEKQKNTMLDNVVTLKEEKLKLDNDISNLENLLANSLERETNLANQIKDLETKLEQLDEEKKQALLELDQLERTKREITHKSELLKETIDNNSTLSFAVQSLLHNPKLNNIHGVIGRLLETEEKYALAVETSLGAALQFVVVSSEQDAKEAIFYLKNNNLGRATFFPLTVISPKGIDENTLTKIKNHPSFLGAVSDFVKYDSKYRRIMLNQLGNVLLVTNLDKAHEIGKLINYQYKIVTLEGELVHVGGSLTGGIFKKVTSLIKEKYAQEDMHRQITSLSSDIQTLKNNYDQLSQTYHTQEKQILALQKEKIGASEVSNNRKTLLQEYQAKVTQLDIELNDLTKVLTGETSQEETTLLTTYYEALKEKEALEINIDKQNATRQDVHNEIAELEVIIRKMNHNYKEKSEEVKTLEIKLNRLDVKLDTLLTTLTNDYSLTYEKAKEHYKLEMDVNEARIKVNTYRAKIKDYGPINLGAIDEYERLNKRYTFLTTQKEDLLKASSILLTIIKEMDEVMMQNFSHTFTEIQHEFKIVFKKLFGGGRAELKLTDPSNMLETGIDIIASPPGKKLVHLSLLSGGEKALTAISLLFAILNIKPAPFCLFDEIEAALDEVNVATFGTYLKSLTKDIQFIIVTHKKKTMEYADTLYGITMQESGVSKLVSVKLEDIIEPVA